MFVDLAADSDRADDYATFYDNFSKNIKLGIYDETDAAGGEAITKKLVSLLRFYSTHDSEKRTSLLDYVTRAKDRNGKEGNGPSASQTKIYYITGESLKQVRNSPFLEKLKAKGYEVLFMVDPIDEYMMQRLREYKALDAAEDEKPFTFCCITKEGALLDEEDNDVAKAAREAQEAAYKPLCNAIKATLEDNVEKVTLSSRISSSPAVLVTGQYSWSATMERIMKSQALASTQAHQYMIGKKTLEINPDHAIIKALKERVSDGGEVDGGAKDLIRLLYDTALLSSGFQIEDASGFVARVHRMIGLGLSLEEDTEVGGDSETGAVEAAGEAVMEEVD
jgi:molecular chaperone HtpG